MENKVDTVPVPLPHYSCVTEADQLGLKPGITTAKATEPGPRGFGL